MQGFSERRRFIAGAVCPRCAAMDRIVVDLDTDSRVCVSCGFRESRPGPVAQDRSGSLDRAAEATGQAQELSTRVSRAAARRVETPAQAITVIGGTGDEGE